MATTRRPGQDIDSPTTIGGFRDSIIAIRNTDSGRGKEVDYLADRTRVTRWLKLLPNDPIQAKEAAFALLSEQNSNKQTFTPERTEALFHFDRGIHSYMLKLETDYLAAQVGGELEEVLWRACSELGRAMIVTYERAFTDNVERLGSRAALMTLTLVIVRIIHYLAWQARLTAYKRHDWIPGRWQQLHRLYRKARAFNIQLHGVSDLSDPARTRKTSIESEYLSLMLMWRLNSGTLSRTELAQAYYWLKDRPRTVVFATTQRPGTRLGVDPTQADGLRPLSQLGGPGERFLFDSTVLSEPLNATITRLEERLKTGPRDADRVRQQIELVRYLTTHWVVNGFPERAERTPTDRRVEGYAGLPALLARLKALEQSGFDSGVKATKDGKSLTQFSAASVSSREAFARQVAPAAGADSAIRRGWEEKGKTGGATGAWVIRDQSATGCRVVSPMPRAIRVGDLICMYDAKEHWDVALVRRWKLAGDDRIEMGLLWLARNARPIKLYSVQSAHGPDSAAPVHGLGGELQGGERELLLALLPMSACVNPERRWERAVPEGKATLKLDAGELRSTDWCWTRMRVMSVEPGKPGSGGAQQSDEVTEINITAPPE